MFYTATDTYTHSNRDLAQLKDLTLQLGRKGAFQPGHKANSVGKVVPTQCQCPIWVDGFLDGEEIRESLKMRDWQRAQDTIRDWEADGRMREKVEKAEPTTIAKGQESFLADAKARGLKIETIKRHRIIFKQLSAFAEARGVEYV